MRVVFFGTGDIAIPAFRRLIEEGPVPVALVTQPDKPVGRHQTLTPPAIKTLALEAGIPVLQPENVREILDELADLRADLMVVMAYGQILPVRLIRLPALACINLHASLLPKYRGAACIQAAIEAGDAETGITVMHVVKRLDAGDMILAKRLPILPGETGGQLHDRLAELAPDAMSEAITLLATGDATREPQDDTVASYVSKLGRDDGRIAFDRTAGEIERKVRAYDPWPGTFAVVLEGGKEKRLKLFPPVEVLDCVLPEGVFDGSDGVIRFGCKNGAVGFSVVQPEGGRKMLATDYLRGRKPESH